MRTFLLLTVLFLGVFATGCKKEEVVIPNITIPFSAEPGDWKADNGSFSYFLEVSMPEITDRVNQTNGVLVYMSDDGEIWKNVPEVFDGRTFVYSYATGVLYIDVQGANGDMITPPTTKMYFKVVLVDSDY